MRRRAYAAGALLMAMALLPGCSVTRETPDEFQIDTGFIGEIVPGTRSWWGYPQAREHCAKYGRDAELVDYKGSVAVYRCVAPAKT